MIIIRMFHRHPYFYSSHFKLLCFYGFFLRLSNCYVDSITSFIMELLMALTKSFYMMYFKSVRNKIFFFELSESPETTYYTVRWDS